MSFWPGKGLFANRNKRQPRVRLVWVPPEKFYEYNNGANQMENPKKSNGTFKEENGNGLSIDNNQIPSPVNDVKCQRKMIKNGESGRGKKKRRNCKQVNGQSSTSDDQERLNGKHENGGKGNDKVNVVKVPSESSNRVVNGEKRSRSRRSCSKLSKLNESTIIEVPKVKNETKVNGDSMNQTNHDDDDDSDDWDGVRDAIGPVTRCSSSSSLSSSCSNSSLIKHYTNVIMNCCDNHFKEDCDNVRAKIDRILKAHWKDRLNRYKVKSSPSNDDNCSEKTDSQPSKQSSPATTDPIAFELRPSRLPLNKKTWTKLRRSNRNSDWLLNEET